MIESGQSARTLATLIGPAGEALWPLSIGPAGEALWPLSIGPAGEVPQPLPEPELQRSGVA